jgi:uncharacterized membrane protein YeaQ/YmgE (transglycosylase-associated protein family)
LCAARSSFLIRGKTTAAPLDAAAVRAEPVATGAVCKGQQSLGRIVLMSIIAWLVLGLVAGFIASKIVNHTGSGLIMDIVIGVVGAFIGGFVFTRFFDTAGVTGFNLYSLFVAVLGAIVLLLLYHLIIGRRRPIA